jgi:hypothetical protein
VGGIAIAFNAELIKQQCSTDYNPWLRTIDSSCREL